MSSICAASDTPTYDRLVSEALRSPTDINLLKACTAAQAGISEVVCNGETSGQVKRQCMDVSELGCCWNGDNMCMTGGDR